jgi:RNA polymerase sigma-70 factor (ECF subfamily)
VDEPTRRRLNAQLGALQAGDRSAFDAVFRGLWPVVLGFARRAAPPDEADDVAQTAMVKLFEQVHRYDPQRDGVAWALTLTAWECRTARRRRSRRREASLDAAAAADGSEDRMLERLLFEEARALLSTLSPLDQETLEAFMNDTGRGATFRKRKERALGRLRQAWRMMHG